MIKYMITGGLGFIGSNFLKYVLEKYKNCFFVCVDKCTYAANTELIDEFSNYHNFRFYKVDIFDFQKMDNILIEEEIDIIINFAAESHVDKSFNNQELFYQTNVGGTRTLLELSVKNRIKKFVQISTDEVYGDSGVNKIVFDEKSSLNPRNPYSKTKAEADELVIKFHEEYGLNVNITRSSNNYGPFQYPEKLIPVLICKCMKCEKVPIYGNGLNLRDWIYVRDNIEAIELVTRKGKNGEIYNISTHNEYSNIEVAKCILNYFKKDESWIEYVPDRLINDFCYMMSAKKIAKLGFKKKYDFKQTLYDTIRWYEKNWSIKYNK